MKPYDRRLLLYRVALTALVGVVLLLSAGYYWQAASAQREHQLLVAERQKVTKWEELGQRLYNLYPPCEWSIYDPVEILLTSPKDPVDLSKHLLHWMEIDKENLLVVGSERDVLKSRLQKLGGDTTLSEETEDVLRKLAEEQCRFTPRP
jgi:hypothetical protein